MATTIHEVTSLLNAMELKHALTHEGDIAAGFGDLEYFRNNNGSGEVVTIIRLGENGATVVVSAPWLFVVKDDDRAALLAQAFAILHARVCFVKFQYDPSDGEVRACFEVLPEDTKLSEKVLRRSLLGLVQVIDQVHPILLRVIEIGVIDLTPIDKSVSTNLSMMLERVPPDILAEALRLADERRRAQGL